MFNSLWDVVSEANEPRIRKSSLLPNKHKHKHYN